MRYFTALSAKTRLAVVVGATLAVGALAVPAAYASTVSQPTAPLGQTASVSVSVSAEATASTSGCAGTIEAHADNNHEALTFWYTKLANHVICIGTIKTSSYPHSACVNPQVRIYSGGVRVAKFFLAHPDGSKYWVCPNSTIKTFYWDTWPKGPSHKAWSSPVQVVGSAEIQGGHGELGPASVTVN